VIEGAVHFRTLDQLISDFRNLREGLSLARKSFDNIRNKPAHQPKNEFIADFVNSRFGSFTLSNFVEADQELNAVYSLVLIASAEGSIRRYYQEVGLFKKPKADHTRALKNVFDQFKEKASLENLIEQLKQVKKQNVALHQNESKFLSLLKFRHWMAHGRHWPPNLQLSNPYDYKAEDVHRFLVNFIRSDFPPHR